MKNFAEGVDYLLIHGLNGLPAPGALYVWLCDDKEADFTAADGIRSLTMTAFSTAAAVTGLTSSARLIDLGSIPFLARVGTPKSLAVTTADPANPIAKLLAMQDINGGSTLDLSAVGPYVCDSLSFKFAYEGEV